MRQNIFLGGGPFGSQQVAVLGPKLGQYSYPMQAQGSPLTQHMQPVQDMTQNPYSWNNAPAAIPPSPAPLRSSPQSIRSNQAQAFTRPTSQPTAFEGGSDVGCYFCTNLSGSPTYWMSESQAKQWNKDRDARCTKVADKECQQKYGRMQAHQRENTGFNVFNFPSDQVATSTLAPAVTETYASMMSGRIRVQNPGLIG